MSLHVNNMIASTSSQKLALQMSGQPLIIQGLTLGSEGELYLTSSTGEQIKYVPESKTILEVDAEEKFEKEIDNTDE